MSFILEVHEFEKCYAIILNKLGFMNKIFNSDIEAAEYYNNHNKHMRKINSFRKKKFSLHGYLWKSDWDPITYRFYLNF